MKEKQEKNDLVQEKIREIEEMKRSHSDEIRKASQQIGRISLSVEKTSLETLGEKLTVFMEASQVCFSTHSSNENLPVN